MPLAARVVGRHVALAGAAVLLVSAASIALRLRQHTVGADQALWLEPGRSGRLTADVAIRPGDIVNALLWIRTAPGLHNAVECAADEGPFVPVANDASFDGFPLQLTPCGGASRRVAVRVSATRSAGGDPAGVAAVAGLRVVRIAAAHSSWWDVFPASSFAVLEADAENVIASAGRMRAPYDAGVREPLWLWAARGFRVLTGDYRAGLRMYSVTSFGLLLIVLFVFARDYFGGGATAVIATGFLATHAFWAASATRGLRTELYAAALLAVCYFALVPALSQRRRAGGLSVCVCALALTEFTSLLAASAFVGLAWARRRIGARHVAVIAIAATAAVGPYLVHNRRAYGQALWFQNVASATFYRNVEFVARSQAGCDGCPDRATYAAEGAYSGRPATMREYLFELHTFREVFARIARGYVETYVTPGPWLWLWLGRPHHHRFFYPLYVLGALMIALSRHREILLLPICGLGLTAFILALAPEPRLVMHTSTVGAICMAYPVAVALNWMRGRRAAGRRSPI